MNSCFSSDCINLLPLAKQTKKQIIGVNSYSIVRIQPLHDYNTV